MENYVIPEETTQDVQFEPSPQSNEVPPQVELPVPILPANDAQLGPAAVAAPAVAQADTAMPEETADPVLDENVLMALGELLSDTPEFGPKIHENLSKLWQPILKKGLPNETKEKLSKEHLTPQNCDLLQAPKLNPEISAAVPEMVRNRDKSLQTQQQQLGCGLSAINKGLDILLKSDDKHTALKQLSDGCRILSDLHHEYTKNRIKLLTPSLDKTILHVIHDLERDNTIFGSKLSEKIKAAKAIERQGTQIKKTTPASKVAASTPSSSSRPTYQGNWVGPPRYPSNRGGRGGIRKQTSSVRRPQIGGYLKSSTQHRQSQGKPRAPPQ